MIPSRGSGSGRASGVTIPSNGVWRGKAGGVIEVRSEGPEGPLALSGTVAGADERALRIALSGQGGALRTVGVTGRWRLDERQRLGFVVEGSGTPAASRTLTFEGAWETSPDNELSYRLRKAPGEIERRIKFAGYWALWGDRGLRYVLQRTSGRSDALEFEGAFRTRSLYPSRGKVLFALGARGRRGPRSRSIALYGEWKIGRAGSVELEWAPGPRGRLRFGATYAMDERREATVTLTFPGSTTPAGIELVLKRRSRDRSSELTLTGGMSPAERRLIAAWTKRW